ncbi:MAG: hypothetical protein HY303_04695 [Candidatus Wallbacteria bacterium]|nr:hypothetical protein [Candidatus Wallbacteria bacterium]
MTEVTPPRGRPAHPIGFVRWLTGWALIALGVLGLFLPVLQGVALILAGVAVLGRDSAAGRTVRNWRSAYLHWRRQRRRRLR